MLGVGLQFFCVCVFLIIISYLWVFFSILLWNPKVHLMFGEKTTCATISLHLYILQYKPEVPCCMPYWQLLFSCGDFSNGVHHVMKTAMAESSPDMRILTRPWFCFDSVLGEACQYFNVKSLYLGLCVCNRHNLLHTGTQDFEICYWFIYGCTSLHIIMFQTF